jgi:ADP-ribosylglycohydrolase
VLSIARLNAAIWAVENSQSFEGAVLKAVNLGDDADTVGAVAGQIAGAIYGYSSVPKYLKAGLLDERKLYVTSQFLTI